MNDGAGEGRPDLKECSKASGKKSSRWPLLARLAWGALFLVHLAPMWAIASQIASAPSAKLILSLTAVLGISALALLKAVDVPWLRIHLNKRGWCAVILIGLLFHGEAIANQLPDGVIETSVMVSTILACIHRQTLERIQTLISSAVVMQVRSISYWIEEVALAKWLDFHLILPSPRGPPVR
jgi:hypothetical protein